MLRFVARTVIALVANAIGLIVAAWLLDDMTLNATGLLIDVLVFTVVAGPHPAVRRQVGAEERQRAVGFVGADRLVRRASS